MEAALQAPMTLREIGMFTALMVVFIFSGYVTIEFLRFIRR